MFLYFYWFLRDGQLKDVILKRRDDEKIMFILVIPMNPLEEYIQLAMISLVLLANISVLSTSSPNKLIESLDAREK